jgi:hypothetical protein
MEGLARDTLGRSLIRRMLSLLIPPYVSDESPQGLRVLSGSNPDRGYLRDGQIFKVQKKTYQWQRKPAGFMAVRNQHVSACNKIERIYGAGG